MIICENCNFHGKNVAKLATLESTYLAEQNEQIIATSLTCAKNHLWQNCAFDFLDQFDSRFLTASSLRSYEWQFLGLGFCLFCWLHITISLFYNDHYVVTDVLCDKDLNFAILQFLINQKIEFVDLLHQNFLWFWSTHLAV